MNGTRAWLAVYVHSEWVLRHLTSSISQSSTDVNYQWLLTILAMQRSASAICGVDLEKILPLLGENVGKPGMKWVHYLIHHALDAALVRGKRLLKVGYRKPSTWTLSTVPSHHWMMEYRFFNLFRLGKVTLRSLSVSYADCFHSRLGSNINCRQRQRFWISEGNLSRYLI